MPKVIRGAEHQTHGGSERGVLRIVGKGWRGRVEWNHAADRRHRMQAQLDKEHVVDSLHHRADAMLDGRPISVCIGQRLCARAQLLKRIFEACLNMIGFCTVENGCKCRMGSQM